MKKSFFFFLLFFFSFSLFAADLMVIPDFLISTGGALTRTFDNDKPCNVDFYFTFSGELRFLIPDTLFDLNYSLQADIGDVIKLDFRKCHAKFSLSDYIFFQIGRFNLNWNDNLVWNVSDVINNKQFAYSNKTVTGKDALEVAFNLPFNSFSMDLTLASVFSEQIDKTSFYCRLNALFYPIEIKLKTGWQYGKYPIGGLTCISSYKNFKFAIDTALLPGQSLKKKMLLNDETLPWRISAQTSYNFSLQNHYFSCQVAYLFQSDGLTKTEEDLLFANGISATHKSNMSNTFMSNYRQYINIEVDYNFRKDIQTALRFWLNCEDLSGCVMMSINYMKLSIFDIKTTFLMFYGDNGTERDISPFPYSVGISLEKSF
ncbi:MAG: hypothetical protein K5751_12345 [Treponemataceae bacterium]|nr:hypothetical protein [Treponemataceae bacterium]